MSKRVFLIVLDSMGIGEEPDAADFGDEGSNTLGAIRNHPAFACPNLQKLGLMNIEGVGGGVERPAASFARMREASRGKDTTVGHWEIAGCISASPLPTYPEGFPPEVTEAFTAATGYGVLCNRPMSGTDAIRIYGEEHLRTGKLILYTSADSVFQIAAHEDKVPVEELYRVCAIARKGLTGKHGVGRVIARPFTGEYPFKRTARRHDFSLEPTGCTMLDCLRKAGRDVRSVGKIADIFAGRGVTWGQRTADNDEGMKIALEQQAVDFHGLCFVNLVDFDMVYGHRNDVAGYAAAMTAFDRWLPGFLAGMREEDLLLITADHGCDPATPSTDHSREYAPLLLYGKPVRAGVNLGTRSTFADIAATVLDYLETDGTGLAGESFWNRVKMPGEGELMQAAFAARKKAYAPYSRYRVGAALLTKEGRIFTGCNVENAAYSPTLCAERVAVGKAVSEGYRNFAAVAVCGGGEVAPDKTCPPCGVCRQVLSEFCAPDLAVVLGTPEEYGCTTLGALLPGAFRLTETD